MASFRFLGPVEIVVDGRAHTLRQHKLRQILALLALRAGQIVDTDLLIQELWAEQPAKNARTILHTYVYQLRKHAERYGLCRQGEELVETRTAGYLLRADRAAIDVFRFDDLVRRGRLLLQAGDAGQAAVLLREALDMWSGRALADVVPGPVLNGHVVALEEQRLCALQTRIEADMELGGHRELIPELRLLVGQHPYNEWFHGMLISALGRADRRNEALDAYQNLRRILDEELGLAPSPATQELHRELLSAGMAHR
ncbi:AfsR/SARP family transcriptional regulator [Nonomuraea sp. FMUSA5-5]|uniref:AfsR/SARP family transcriptional regulator n=1 Tax=Nonomuraea composti TaxID=2720023 RepID=A0ABX1BLX6_9ACTN|nr:AfsR/SARP family transcriptional regulator [Nonomuraea sp. FMUSA5-5]NJP96261.1 AfsR/SARP family transcriptional regulator [Nonomuraea sp. FMUSA5-5]